MPRSPSRPRTGRPLATSRRVVAAAVASLVLPIVLTGGPADADVRNPWWYEQMRIARAHRATEGEGVRICVIDSSINPDVPELQGADVRLKGETKPYPKSGYAGHGTAMVALLVGQGKGTVDGRGITGIAPKARVDFYGVSQEPYRDSNILLIDLGLYAALRDGCKLISVSMATTTDTELAEYADEAQKKGAIIVAGGGVAGADEIGYPAGDRGVVGVGAVDSEGYPWSEQPGQEKGYLAISAPGVDVPVGGTKGPPRDATWDSSIERTGTSPATPLVAGVLALTWSKWPKATANQLIQSLVHNTTGRDGKAAWEYERPFGYGIANVTRMLRQDPAGWPDVNPLLEAPRQALADYPQSVYREPRQSEPAALNDAASSDTTDPGGFPVLPVGLGALAVVVVAALTILLVRRRTTSTAPREES